MTADVLDFQAKKAERLAETQEPLMEEDIMLACTVCDNKAFTLLTTNRKDATFPGWDVICTACDTILEMSGEWEHR